MANRHLSRSIVMQSLFEWDFNDRQEKLETILERNIKEFAPGISVDEYPKELTINVQKKIKVLDSIIVKAAPEWPIPKIAIVDRNILRIGLYELLFMDKGEVPAKVAINEAIELAKTFGGETSGKFVNGVLGAVYRELGEPGKDEGKKRKHPPATVPYEKMPIEKLGGAVVYAQNNKKIYLAFVHDIFGHWTLSKGKIEAKEDESEGTIREIKEEIGVDIKIQGEIGKNEYIASDPERGKIRKQVTYFLGEALYMPLTLGKSGGLDATRWFSLDEISGLNIYDDILPILAKGIKMITK
ncbi:MAG: transcription antitermination factor NusB [Parcubacteria group bacterium]|nr:transcription antitermination factor NusB [Parcubacteria group bacterium]